MGTPLRPMTPGPWLREPRVRPLPCQTLPAEEGEGEIWDVWDKRRGADPLGPRACGDKWRLCLFNADLSGKGKDPRPFSDLQDPTTPVSPSSTSELPSPTLFCSLLYPFPRVPVQHPTHTHFGSFPTLHSLPFTPSVPESPHGFLTLLFTPSPSSTSTPFDILPHSTVHPPYAPLPHPIPSLRRGK